MYLSAKWVSGRSIAAALQSHLTMDRPPSGTSSPVIREPSRGRPRRNKVSVDNSTEPCSEKVLSYTDHGFDPWQKDAPIAGKASSLRPLSFIWNTQIKSCQSKGSHPTRCEYLYIKRVSVWLAAWTAAANST